MLSTETLYLLYLSTGFTVGFGHCIGMCGPIMATLSLNLKEKSILISQLFYHLGRITTYAMLGGIVAAVGSLTIVAANIESVQKGVMIFAGALVILMGLAMAGWLPFGGVFGDHSNTGGWITTRFSKLLKLKSTWVYLPLGLLLGLLPCGPVYTALVGAARSGMEANTLYQGIFAGMGLMLAFGIGTVPALFLVAKVVDMGWLKNRNFIYRFGAVFMIIVGIVFIVRAIRF